jgi:hypothetical protein
MFRGFKIESLSIPDGNYQEGLELFEASKVDIQRNLKNSIFSTSSLDGSAIQSNWFPQIDAHVFISHSHDDKDMAIALSGWLWRNFQIKAFVDSMIWSYANELLKQIDDSYCLNEGKTAYDYHTRNFSTAHVHMMLSTALAMMIDKTECIFFLATDNSVSVQPVENIKNTKSAWIYFEIATTQLVQKKQPIRQLLESTKTFSEKELIKKSLEVTYTLDLDHLSKLEVSILNTWVKRKYSSPEDALDTLYALCPAKKVSNSLHG